VDFITEAELEAVASECFGDSGASASRVWIDWLDGSPFIRVCLVGGITPAGLARLGKMRRLLHKLTGYRYVGVAYGSDMDWHEIEGISARLRSL
jgi:hypothetical protein